MFTKEQLEGALIAISSPQVVIEKDEKQDVGYRVRLRIHLRATNSKFLLILQETLEYHGIDCNFKDYESDGRPYPMLRISKTDNLINFMNLMPDLPTSNNKFDSFVKILTIVSNKHHLLQKGIDEILAIKGVWV